MLIKPVVPKNTNSFVFLDATVSSQEGGPVYFKRAEF